MGSDNQINIIIGADASSLEKATQTTASFIETVEQIPDVMTDAMQSVSAASGNLAGNNPITAALNALPQSLRSSMIQMIDIAKYQNEQKAATFSAAKGDAKNADYLKTSAVLDATVHTVSNSLLKLNNVFSSASRLFGNNTNGIKAFGTSMSSLQKYISNVVDKNMNMLSDGGLSDAAIKQILLKDTGVKGGLAKTIANLKQHSDYARHSDILNENAILDALIPTAVSSMYRQDYWKYAASKSGGHLKRAHYANYVKNYLDSLPEPFNHLPQDPRKMTAEQKAAQHNYGDQQLTSEEWDTVRKIAANNATFEAALINRGLAMRGISGSKSAKKAGSLLMPTTPISKQQLAEALGSVALMNAEALEGAPAWRKNLSSRNGYDQEVLANKSSRIPSDVRRLGRDLETLGIQAVIPSVPAKQEPINTSGWTLAKRADGRRSVVSVRPNQYQIQALTYEDFKAGKTLPVAADSKYILNDEDDEYAGQRTSKYRFISDSAFASFVGMKGHNTFGNGSKDDNSRPIIMSMDLTNGAMETDALGNQVWENGLPKINAAHEQRLTQMYAKNASMDYIQNDVKKAYNYARVQLGTNGDYYVPVNQKSNGTATMIREDVFLSRSKPLLEKYGVSPFDNFVAQDYQYKNEEEFSKVTEARNRAMTDSVANEVLGGRRLSKNDLNKIAIVDFGVFTEEDKKALDGTSFAMPGQLPADAAVVRMGLSSVKGVAQQWDFHQYLKDMTGNPDLKKFYMVSSTASDDIKEFAKNFSGKQNGSIRQAFESDARFKDLKFDDYFVNVMDMDWLLSDTMIKTPFLKQAGLTQSQIRERLGDIMFDENGVAIPGMGLRIHKTDEGALVTDQASLSQQLTRTLLFNDDELDARVREHVTKINRLRNDPAYQMRYIFNDPTNPLHQAVNKNWGLTHYAPEARKAIEDAVAAEEKDFYQNRIKTHGNAAMALALMDPYLAFAGSLAINEVADANNILHLTDDQIAFNAERLGQRNQQNLNTIAFRFPYTKGQHYKLDTEQRQKFMKQVAKYGGSVNGVYVTPQAIAKMGGGDFDGDTLQLLFGDLATIAERTQNSYIQTEDKTAPQSKPMNRAATAADMARLAFRSSVAPIQMGGIERAQQILMEQNWNDPEMQQLYSESARHLADAYDIDSTYLKTGVAAEWTKEMNATREMGTAFSKAFKFAFGAIQENDFSKMESFADVNLPSIYSAFTANAAAASRSTPFSSVMSQILSKQNDLSIAGRNKSVNELLNATGENQLIDRALGKYYEHRNRMIAQHMTTGAVFSDADINELRALGVQYNAEFAYAQKRLPADSAQYKAYERRQKTIQNDLKQIDRVGLTETNVREGKGYARAFVDKNGELVLTGEIAEQSDFDEGVIEAQRADWTARQAIATDDTMVAATRAADIIAKSENPEIKRLRERVQKGFSTASDRNGHGWSWTQIQKFHNDRDTWFREYVQGKRDKTIPVSTTIGSAFHKAAEMHLRQLAGEEIEGPYAGKTSSEIFDMFLEGKTQEGREQGGQENFNRNKLRPDNKAKYDRSKHALSLIDDLFNRLGVTKVLGAEQTVSPDFAPEGMDVWTTGSTDAQIQLADGSLATLDWKPDLTKKETSFEQANLYAHTLRQKIMASGDENAVLPTKVIIATHQGRDQNGRLQYEVFDYDEEKAQETLKKGRDAIQTADAAAQIGQLENPNYWKHPELYDPMKFREEVEKPPEHNPEQDRQAWKAYNESLAHKSGEEIAHAMAGYQEIHELSENALGLSRKYGSIARKAEKPETPRNRWTDARHQLDYMEADQVTQLEKYNYDEKNPHVAQAQANINDAKSAYDDALRVSSTADLERFIKTLSQIPGTSKGLQSYLKQAEDLKQSFNAARAAYNELQSKVDKETQEAVANEKRSKELTAEREALRAQYESETDEDKRKELYAQMKAKEEEHAKLSSGANYKKNKDALKKAEGLSEIAEHDTQVRLAELNARTVEETLLNASSLYLRSSGQGLSVADQSHLAVIKEKNEIDTAVADIDTLLSEEDGVNKLFKEDLLSGDDSRVQYAKEQINKLTAQRQALLNIDWNQREQDIAGRYASEEQRRMSQSTRRVERLRTQGRRLDRNLLGSRSNDIFTRSYNEWQTGKDQYADRLESLQVEIDREKEIMGKNAKGSDAYKTAEKNLKGLQQQLDSTQASAKSFDGAMGLTAVAQNNVGESVSRVISQFGRQMFQKAIQEAKRFVQEYDAAMTEIQMVTGKTDAEISALGSSLVQTAIDMKVGVSDVTTAATELYRQGIDDEEVSVRMEDVLKFSKVAGIKADEASKIITTALSNNLVENSGEAMDALVALGDAAATSAQEIAKGMQKSAASAKQAGVSYEELVTMLTIITSKTQLGGNQAGTALQTLMYRLYRVNDGEDFYDENGNRIAANDASKALKELGVSIYDENGQPRGAFDIMVDVAKNWDNASNISQEMVLNALGAGRQRSNIATLIQGLAEDDGALMEKYMNLATGSEGVTDEKYLAYLDSLNAALTNVQNSFDQLIASFEVSGTATDILDFISEFIQGLAAAEEASGALSKAITVLGAALAVIAVVSNLKNPLMYLAAAGALVLGTVSAVGNNAKTKELPTQSEQVTYNQRIATNYKDYSQMITESEALLRKESLTQLETDQLQSNLDALSSRFGTAAIDLNDASTQIKDVADILKQARVAQSSETATAIKYRQEQSVATATEEIASIYANPSELQITMDSVMLTDYSGARQGYVSKEADYNQDGVISLDEAARHSTQYLYDQLHYNDYLNGTKALTDYNWTEASESERTQHSRASGFLAWFDQYNDNILSSLTKYGLSLDLGGLPLSKDNLMTLLTTPYDELWDNEAVRNSDAWAAVFASSDNTGTNKTYYEAKAMETTRALYDLWVATSGDVSGVSDSRRNKVEAIVADMMDRDVLPYTDEETASLFQKAFLNRQEANQYFAATSRSEAMEIYADTQRDMHNALYDGGKVDYEGWASRYLSEDEQAIWKVINVQTGESLQDGALYTKNEADELLQNLTADKLIKNGEEIFASFDTDELLRYRRAQIENDVYRQMNDPDKAGAQTTYSLDGFAGNTYSTKTSALEAAQKLSESEYHAIDGTVFNSADALINYYQTATKASDRGYGTIHDAELKYRAAISMLNPSTYAALFANDELYQFADNNRWLQVDQGQYDDALQAIRGQEYSNVALEDRYNFALNHLGIGMNIDELVDLYFDAISDGLYSTPIVPEVLENTQYYIRQRAGLTQQFDDEESWRQSLEQIASANYSIESGSNTDLYKVIAEKIKADESVPKEAAINYMESALRQGLAASETDESKLKNQADQFARLLVARGVVSDGVIDFDAFNDLMSSNKYGDLTSVFQSIDGLATIVDSVIARDLPSNAYLKTEDGKYVVSDNAALKATRGKEAWDAILAATGSYSTIASASRLSQYAYIQQLNAMYDNGIQLSEDEWNTLSSAYGESLIGKKRRASAEWWDTTRDNELINDDGTFKKDESGGYTNQSAFVQQWIQETSARNAFIEETGGTLDQSNELTWSNYLAEAQRQNKRLRNDETIYTSQEQTYYDTLDQNMLYGISGLTQQQSLAGAQDILSAITAGNLSGYLAQDAEMLNAYLSGFSNLSAYVAMAQGLEAEGISNGAGSVYTMNDILGLQESDEGYSAVAAVIDKLGYTMEEARDIAETLNEEMAAVQKPYGELTDEVLANSKAWKGNKREIANAQKTLNETQTSVLNNQYYRQQFKAGARDSQTMEMISSMTGLDKEYIKEHSEEVSQLLDSMMEGDQEEIQAKVSAFDQYLEDEELMVHLPDLIAGGGDLSAFAAAIDGYTSDAAAKLQELAAQQSSVGITAAIEQVDLGNGVTKYQIKVGDISGQAGRKSSSGGGGGSSKSAAQKLLDEQKREQTLWEHRRKMIQYEATRYQNAGELSNYAIMLGHESEEIKRQIKLREQQLDSLKKQQAATKKNSDDWYEIRDAILSAEEALAELLNDLEEIERTVEEIEQEVLKMYVDMEQEVVSEIEARIQKEREMLDGTVSMQDTILEAIRERYQKEWELMQEDIAKKREALEEESALIDKRLQRRKDAEDKAAKYEELSELKRQLALVSMDSTRTKDQAELREKIAELQKELAWEAAEEEAEAQKEGLQDQIDAYDDYESEYQDYLDDYLEDANNFADEVNSLLAGSQEDLFRWLEENVEAYGNSLDAQQKQMLQNWQDTYNQMKGVVTTFWEEVAGTLSSKENFLAYMKQSDTYRYASESEKQQLEYNWGQMYDSWVSAKKESEAAKDYTHNDGDVTSSGTSSSGTRYRADYTISYLAIDENGSYADTYKGYGLGSSAYEAENVAKIKAQQKVASLKSSGAISVQNPSYGKAYRYAKGGLVDYTGLAWVDGTKAAPEAFLSADDTALVRSMLDAWQFVAHQPTITNVDSALGRGNSGTTFGDIHIEITEASFAEDADYDEVARRVGDAFTKELAKQGFRTASYNF